MTLRENREAQVVRLEDTLHALSWTHDYRGPIVVLIQRSSDKIGKVASSSCDDEGDGLRACDVVIQCIGADGYGWPIRVIAIAAGDEQRVQGSSSLHR